MVESVKRPASVNVCRAFQEQLVKEGGKGGVGRIRREKIEEKR
jgi:hypothetical protein